MHTCESCQRDFDKDETGEKCIFTDQKFCLDCFLKHECTNHKRQIINCISCWKEMWLKVEKPVYDGGDPFCLECIIQKPWLKEKVS